MKFDFNKWRGTIAGALGGAAQVFGGTELGAEDALITTGLLVLGQILDRKLNQRQPPTPPIVPQVPEPKKRTRK